MSSKPKAVPDGMHSVTPHLICDGAAEAIDFYKRAFGATEVVRLPGPDGRLMHGTVKIGDSFVMLVDENPAFGMLGPRSLKGSPVTIHLYVEDADGVVARAVADGATVRMPLADMFWGDRYGVLEDPFGHHWAVATPQRIVSAEDLPQAMQQAMSAQAGR
jgi:uncharacterized glyoxalase superfamily protein PhnB